MTTNSIYSIRICLYLLLGMLISLTMACNDTNEDKSSFNDPMTSEVLTEEAVSLSWDLLLNGQTMADAGKSIQEIIKILPDSTLIQTNGKAIVYFIEGSFPMIIELTRNASQKEMAGSKECFTEREERLRAGFISGMSMTLFQSDEEQVDVVASDKGEDERQEKKAMIISSYSDKLLGYDGGLEAKRILEKNKNYKGRVEFVSDSEGDSLNIAHFKNLHDYDLVHLTIYGARFCDEVSMVLNGETVTVSGGGGNFCRVYIGTGLEHKFETYEEAMEYVTDNGLEDYIAVDHELVYLKTAFFEAVYGGGLENKIWVFGGINELGGSELVEAMRNIHKNGHIFYWQNFARPQDATAAFNKFYENLGKEGLEAKKAYEEIPIELRNNLYSVIPNYDSGNLTQTTTSLLHLQTDQPRHGIEVIEMYHPEKEDKRVRAGDFYPLVGDFGDGQDEAITLKVELKGYKRAEFEEKQMKLSLIVDGETVLDQRPFLPDEDNDEIEVDDLEDQEYGVEVMISGIPIPDVGEKRFIELDARLHFDDNRFSIHSERVSIKPTGILSTITGDGQKLILTYNEDTEAMKIESANNSNTQYMDRDGWLYMEDNDDPTGWKKMNLSGIMGMSVGSMIGANVDMPVFEEWAANNMLQDIQDEQTKNANFFLPMIEWGMRFTVSDFAGNSDFKGQLVDCGKPQPCRNFTGTQGEAKGVEATFNPGGQIIRIKYQGKTITYDYGNYNVTLPEATEFKIPFFNN